MYHLTIVQYFDSNESLHLMLCNMEKINRGGGFGLQVPADYIFCETSKAIEWIRKKLHEIDKAVDMQVQKYLQ